MRKYTLRMTKLLRENEQLRAKLLDAEELRKVADTISIRHQERLHHVILVVEDISRSRDAMADQVSKLNRPSASTLKGYLREYDCLVRRMTDYIKRT